MGLRTPLYKWHAAHGAKLVDFGGWDMPVVYSSITEEHIATRQAVGLFDISHMGRLRVQGAGATAFLEFALTNNVDDLKVGQARYSLVLDRSAGILDDVLLYRLTDGYMLVVNASNRLKLLDWFKSLLTEFEATIVDRTIELGMVAVQGPRAVSLAQTLFSDRLDGVKYYHSIATMYLGCEAIVSRTGYTGEDGVEMIVPAELTDRLWTALVEAGEKLGARPVGLGARDTLRLEAGMPLYGHELTQAIDPIQAGLGWAVKDKEFVGRDALKLRDPERQVRIGLRLGDKRIAREGFPIFQGDKQVGAVTSGTFSPTLSASIAMGYVSPDCKSPGEKLTGEIRGSRAEAEVTPLPFLKRRK